jgi:two-component system nitrogen regulation sensor histidine kinase GlnL
MNITTLNKKKLSLGAKITLDPAFQCNDGKHTFENRITEKIIHSATTVAHGVRNPLNAIKGAAVYIREKYAKEAHLLPFLKIIEEEIGRLDAFIAHYLSSSMNQSIMDEVDVNSVLKKIEILISFQVKSHKIKAVFKCGYPLCVKVNPFLLEQAILNVINNAIEAMSHGGLLTITSKSIKRSGRKYALIEISDTGCGINKSTRRVLSSDKEGRGFGLPITYEILRSVRGHVEIKGLSGMGTAVKLFVPCL